MNIKKIIQEADKPKIFTPGNSVMWTDKHISKQLLDVHLNTDIDLASRKHESIIKTINWIENKVNSKNLKILDLGCGPGIYSEILARKGHTVTGVDFSKNSIEYAKNKSNSEGLNITYICENYLNLKLEENNFDLVMMIFTDFGVLNPDDREKLLNLIYKSLKPGGKFIFDVLSDNRLDEKVNPKSWEAVNLGFWKDQPYVALSESFLYPDEKVILFQHIILDEMENLNTYRFWTSFFSEENVKSELLKNCFTNISTHKDVLPSTGLWDGENVIFSISEK